METGLGSIPTELDLDAAEPGATPAKREEQQASPHRTGGSTHSMHRPSCLGVETGGERSIPTELESESRDGSMPTELDSEQGEPC